MPRASATPKPARSWGAYPNPPYPGESTPCAGSCSGVNSLRARTHEHATLRTRPAATEGTTARSSGARAGATRGNRGIPARPGRREAAADAGSLEAGGPRSSGLAAAGVAAVGVAVYWLLPPGDRQLRSQVEPAAEAHPSSSSLTPGRRQPRHSLAAPWPSACRRCGWTCHDREVPAPALDISVPEEASTTAIANVSDKAQPWFAPAPPPPASASITSREAVAPASRMASVSGEGDNRDRFEHFEVNPVKSAADAPVSTFLVDVDTASQLRARAAAQRRRAAARRRGARRGDGELLRLRVARAGVARGAVRTHHHRHRFACGRPATSWCTSASRGSSCRPRAGRT